MSKRDEALAALGKKYKAPKDVKISEGEDRFREIAKANSGGKTKAAKVRAGSGVTVTWVPTTSDTG